LDNALIVLIALVIDISFGEPPNRWHPVARLGKAISLEMKRAPKGSKAQLIYGIGMVMITLVVILVPVYFLLVYLKQMSSIAYVLIAAILLKFTFSFRGLGQAALYVRKLLAHDNLEQARSHLCSLVSRDTTFLNKQQVVSATVESVAENTCDSFVAPLFYFVFFGIPGAVAYRIVNTFDAMIGYHGKWEYLGKFAAKLDDLLNFIPARLAASYIVMSTWVQGNNASRAWRIMWRDHELTESPNAGWTMGAAAGALAVQLEKLGYYRLGDDHNPLTEETIDFSLHILTLVTIMWSLTCLLAEVVPLVLAP